jgi:hypothetical protein
VLSVTWARRPVTDTAPITRRPVPRVTLPPATPGRLLGLLSVAPALLATSWLVTSVPLAAFGVFHPIAASLAGLVSAVLVVPLGLRLFRRPAGAAPHWILNAPWWSVLATVAVAVGFTAFTIATHSEHVVLRRDPGAYTQIGYWLANHGGLSSTVPASAFGPSPGQLSFASPAFYQVGDLVVPQFMTGWPTLVAAAHWVAGWTGVFVLPPVVGGAAVLAVAGLAARLIGPRWAPVAALLMALAWPVLRVSQTAYSEPVALLLLTGGMCLLADLLVRTRRTDGRPHPPLRAHAFAAGLVLAGGELVRLDFGVDFALILPVVGYLWARRRPEAPYFLGAALIGAVLGILDCAVITLPYVKSNWSSVRLMIFALIGMTAVTLAVSSYLRWSGRSVRRLPGWRWVPGAALVLLTIVSGWLAIRPYVLVDHSTHDISVRTYTEQMQGWLNLPLDGTRGYVEQSLWWVQWYLGWPLIIAGMTGALLLTWRVLRGRDRRWFGALPVYLLSSLQVLLRPGITPDHPWADRRLVVEVIPGIILFGLWATARTVRLARAQAARGNVGPFTRRAARAVPAVVGAVLVGVFVAPMAVAAAPVAAERTELGEVAAIRQVCGALRPTDTVLVVDSLWTPMIRAQCGLPVAQLVTVNPDTIARAAQSIRDAGRSPVLAASEEDELTNWKLVPTRVVVLHTRQDQHQLLRRPDGTSPLDLEFWMARL